MEVFLDNPDLIFRLVEFIVFGILSFVLFRKTGNLKASLNLLENFSKKNQNKEVNNMIYRKEDYQKKEKVEGQTFDKYLKTYRLNKVTGELEETEDVIDIQEMINSSISSCMTEVLSKFFPVADNSEEINYVNEMNDDLDYLQDTFEIVNKYKDIYDLPADYTAQQVFDYVSERSKELSAILEKSNKEVSNNDAKEINQESEQA